MRLRTASAAWASESRNLRCRELLAGPRGAATRAVTRVVPIEVLIDPHEEIIAASDALLRPGNLVRIEGRFSPSTYQIRGTQRAQPGTPPEAQPPAGEIAQALERTRSTMTARNSDLRDQTERYQQSVQALQERNRTRSAEGKPALPLPNAPARPLSDTALEQRILQAQRRLLTGTRIRVEVGYVELLRGTPIDAATRAHFIAEREAEERARQARRTAPTARPSASAASAYPMPDQAAREAALDQASEQVMQQIAMDGNKNSPGSTGDSAVGTDHALTLTATPDQEMAALATTAVTPRSLSRPRRRSQDSALAIDDAPDPVLDPVLDPDTLSAS